MSSDYITHSKPSIGSLEKDSVNVVLDSGRLSESELATEFLHWLEEYFTVESSLFFPSASSAILVALEYLELSKREVIVPSYVCGDVLDAVIASGAKPVLCDIGQDWNVCVENIERCITANTGAVLVPHMFGIPADIEAIQTLGIPIVEDCAQAFGASINGKKVGTFGEFGIFSFNATKCLTTGEGGWLISSLCEYDRLFSRVGRISDLQATLGVCQVKRYDSFLARRRKIADAYFENIAEEFTEKLQSCSENSIFFRFPLTVKGMDIEKLKVAFHAEGIAVRHGVDAMLHRRMGLSDDFFKHTEERFRETLSIPIYPAMSDLEVEKVIVFVKRILG